MDKSFSMMKLCRQRIKISYLWIPYLIFFLPYSGKKLVFFIFMMMTVHELAHIVVAKILGYRIHCIRVYPFGLAAQVQYMGFGDTRKECLIVAAGPLMHITFIPLILLVCLHLSWISTSFYVYLCTINKAFFFFNLLPIYPLDGGRIVQCFMHSFCTFIFAQNLTCIVSGILLTFCIYVKIFQGIGSYLLVLFIYIQLYMSFRNRMYEVFAFYRYRYHHPTNYPICVHKKDDMYRMRHNVWVHENGWMDEQGWIYRKLVKRVGDR